MSRLCTFPACDCVRVCKRVGVKAWTDTTPNPSIIKRRRNKSFTLGAYEGEDCPYCGDAMVSYLKGKAPTRDHILAVKRKGTNRKENICVVCRDCNQDKDDLTLAEWQSLLVANHDPRAIRVAAFLTLRNAMAV